MFDKKILPKSMPSTNNLVYDVVDEPFVDISQYSKREILVEMKYAEQGRKGAVTVAYMRERVAEMLLKAKALLPKGYTFKIYDAWRPSTVQKSLYDEYFEKLKAENPTCSASELDKLTRTFVSYPDDVNQFGFVHSSGGAIDLTLVNERCEELDMGTGFDDFSELAFTASFESSPNEEVKKNRRLLYHALTEVGFTNFPNEWWHYDYGDIFYGAITKKAVRYASVYSIDLI